jgi:O-methyltransferase / aklanonic acid methyltransferase
MNDNKKPGPKMATKAMIEQLFDDAADTYDQAGPSLFTRFGVRLAEHVPLKPGATVLDVATGKGAVILPAARRVGPEGRVTGVDLSETILKEADRAVRAAGLRNVELRKMDAEQLEFPDRIFDAVTCAFSLFLFPDLDAALREMHRVCRPSGCVGVSLFDKTPAPFDPGWPILLKQFMSCGKGVVMPQQVAYAPPEVEALLSRAGFCSITTYSETNDLVFSTLEDWWSFQFTVGTRLTIQSMDEETRRRFKDEYLGKLCPLLAADGFHVSLGVVYAVARR